MKKLLIALAASILLMGLFSGIASGQDILDQETHNCRFWGIVAQSAPHDTIKNHVRWFPNSIENLSPDNPEGWAIGYYPDGEIDPLVYRGQPPAYTDYHFRDAVRDAALAEPRIMVAHVRRCTSGLCAIPDPHAFEREKGGRFWLMGHNGHIDKAVLLNLIRPDYLAANMPVNGANESEWIDSELYFIYMLQTFEDFDFDIKPALGHVIQTMRDALADHRLNFFLTDGINLWAYREGTSLHPLHYIYNATVPYSAISSQYPSSTQGDWIEMINGQLVTLYQDAPPDVENIEDYFNYGTEFLADNYFDECTGSADLAANTAGQDWYESRGTNPELLTLNTDNIGGNNTPKAAIAASSTGNAYLSQEFGSPQTGQFAVQWDIYIDEILNIADPDRTGFMLIGDESDPTRPGPNSDNDERFLYMAFGRDGGGTSGTMDLFARDTDDGWTAFTTIATGLNMDQWYTIKVVCDLDTDTYDIYLDGIYQATMGARTPKESVTHITFAQWNDGSGAFFVDNVMKVAEGQYTLTMAADPADGGMTDPSIGGHPYDEDETVSLTAIPYAGFGFDYWDGDVDDMYNQTTSIFIDGNKDVTAHFQTLPTVFLADNGFEASVNDNDLRVNRGGQDWYESRETNPELVTINRTNIGGNSTSKAAIAASSSGNVYLSQEFGTAQSGEFAVQWDVYIDEILDITVAPDRTCWTLIGDNSNATRPGPNSDNDERFAYIAFARDGGGTSGTMSLVARDADDGWTALTTVATGLNMDQWYTMKVVCNLDTDTYDIYIDGAYAGTVGARTPKTQLTHITFSQWNDGAGAFYIDNVTDAVANYYSLSISHDPFEGGATIPAAGDYSYASGTVVDLVAEPASGYIFDHWDGDVADPGTATTTILMDADKAVIANFVEAGFGSIQGNIVNADGVLPAITVNLYDGIGNQIGETSTDELGDYLFSDLIPGDYIVEVFPPMGCVADGGNSVAVTCIGASVTVNFSLSEVEPGELITVWFLQKYFEHMDAGTPLYRELDIDRYCLDMFDHYYDRSDGNAITIEWVTFVEDPARPLNYDDVYEIIMGPADNSNQGKIRKNLFVVMLNVAAGCMLQNNPVTVDGATLSQTIKYVSDSYMSGDFNWKHWYYLNNIQRGTLIPAGYVPLGTPNIMFREDVPGFDGLNLPDEYALGQNYPNPFNPVTEISFLLQAASDVTLDVYNIMGQKVATLADGKFGAGRHTVKWDASISASGLYFYRIKAGEFVESRKMLLLK